MIEAIVKLCCERCVTGHLIAEDLVVCVWRCLNCGHRSEPGRPTLIDLATAVYRATEGGRSYRETGIQDSDDAEQIQVIRDVLQRQLHEV